ncbi:MAG: HTH-type transcriptional repressor OpcR [candidate division TA06 bacterium ADurb.Bin417]|uniref:HTH-type transcriptional regulator n=1 Tax=candidate division TA06 bacterium ADurb.Bin417 TaxID=1852828 RepID=A0A1V5MHW6_UNCT6|nr:MAG: HTH-type transcriptional repressor OpcR [candidate division TA06 bacterium ADurb.Bin417]
MNKDLDRIRDSFIESVGELGASLGLNRVTCQLYAVLYLENRPLSLTELSQALHISKGSASINIRNLKEWGAVRPVWRKGAKGDFYQADRNLPAIVKNRVRIGVDKRLTTLQHRLSEISGELERHAGVKNSEEARLFQEYQVQVRNLRRFAEEAARVLELLG